MVNPCEHIKTITFHSNTHLEGPPVVESMRKSENEKQEDERADKR